MCYISIYHYYADPHYYYFIIIIIHTHTHIHTYIHKYIHTYIYIKTKNRITKYTETNYRKLVNHKEI